MNRDYNNGPANNVSFFIGYEVEHTPAWGMQTLFVNGIHSTSSIFDEIKCANIEHIFFGANHSYNPQSPDEHDLWESMIKVFLNEGYLCSLDIPINQVEEFHDGGLCSYDNFIPQIRVPIPYVKLWNYNTMVKIDDIDFKATNPGVWTYSLHSLMDRDHFTSWVEYRNDEIVR